MILLVQAIPKGIISMWAGATSSIPSGWALCDGTRGTPDLRGRFVVGADSSFPHKTSGGSSTVYLQESNLPPHRHSGYTDTDGAHNHKQGIGAIDDKNFGGGPNQWPAADANTWYETYYTIGSAESSHSHYFTTSTGPGYSAGFSILPPYYALAYIMKL